MKQTWTVFLLVIVTALPALAASITVKTPAAGASIEIGLTQPITWTFAGLPNTTKVKIVLWRSGSSLGIVAQNLAIGSNGQGSYSWKAGDYTGGPAVAGDGYRVRVRTMDESLSAFGPVFSLKAKPASSGGPIPLPGNTIPKIGLRTHPCLEVTVPKAGALTDPFNVIYVMWTKNGSQDANVSVTLLRRVTGKGAILGTEVPLAASTPNDGQFNWDTASLNPAPGTYAIKVRTLDGKCEAVSGDFIMQEMGGIELLGPKGGEVWENGTAHAVTWKRAGNIRTVDVMLARTGSWNKALATGIDAKLGSVSCVFPRDANDPAGSQCYYRVFFKHSAGGSSDFSGCFTLTGNPELAVAAVNFQGLVSVGTDQNLSVKIENKGEVASQPCQGILKVNGVTTKTFPVPAIPPGGSATVPVTWKVSCPGKITIVIDAGGANVEADKANNVWEKNFC